MIDRLLVSSFIEARSCERLELLGKVLPPGRLKDLYCRLSLAEAGHHRLFVDLAERYAGGQSVEGRLKELAESEAAIVARLPLLPRIH